MIQNKRARLIKTSKDVTLIFFTLKRWYDGSLIWNMTKYGGITHTSITGSDMWKPRLSLING